MREMRLGQGTWEMAEDPSKRPQEIEALQLGVDLGMTLIDTAEMYADGRAEELIAEALGDRRKELYLVSKVLPQHATLQGTIAACEKSLRRLKTDYLDLYLLHWRGQIPLEETLQAFQELKEAGKIREYGVSNFDVDDLEEAIDLPGGKTIATNQVLYNLTARGIEYQLLPWSQKHDIPVMAYTPFGHGALLRHEILKSIAAAHQSTPAQVALAWTIRQKGVIAIPKAGTTEHVRDNIGALKLTLTKQDLAKLDQAFPPPTKKSALEVL